MSFWGSLHRECQHFSHGGRRLLTLRWASPTGESPAAAHYRRAVELLVAYGRDVLFQQLCRQLEQAVARGEGHRLLPHCYEIALHTQKQDAKGVTAVTLSAALTAGNTPLYKRESHGFWTSEGALRLPARRRARAQEIPKIPAYPS